MRRCRDGRGTWGRARSSETSQLRQLTGDGQEREQLGNRAGCVPGLLLVTDTDQALADPELAVLSAMAHGHDDDPIRSAQIAAAAQLAIRGLDESRLRLYFDLVSISLSEAASRALRKMTSANYEYQSDFARTYVAQGREEGGRSALIALITKQLAQRFGPLTDESQSCIAAASIAELDAIGERLLTARTLQEALG